jgi:hypothetical protein
VLQESAINPDITSIKLHVIMAIPKQYKSTAVNVNHKLRHQHGVAMEFHGFRVRKIQNQVK